MFWKQSQQYLPMVENDTIEPDLTDGIVNMPSCTIFYSWQSDQPPETNRIFIENALATAILSLVSENSLQVEPVVDRDTLGVPGAPDIAATILEKIERAQIFVCDVSIINPGQSARPTPNPNVLLELGYALKALEPQRIIMVINTAFGAPEQLPLDFKTKRVVSYHMPLDGENRESENMKLATELANAIQIILTNSTPFSAITRQTWPENGKALSNVGHEALERGDFSTAKEVFFCLVSLSTDTRHEAYLRGQTPIPDATPFPLAMKLLRAAIQTDFGLFISILHRCRTHALIDGRPFVSLPDYDQIPDRSFGVLTGVLSAACIYGEPTRDFWAERTIVETLGNILLSLGFAFLRRGTGLPPPTTRIWYTNSGQRAVPEGQPREFLPFIQLVHRFAFLPEPLFDYAIENLKYRPNLSETTIKVDAEGLNGMDEALTLVRSWSVVPGFANTVLTVRDEKIKDECIRAVNDSNEIGSCAVSRIRENLTAERECVFRQKKASTS